MNILIVEGGREYHKFFERLGFDSVTSIEQADVVCFTGGEDVSPSLYGDMQHETTWNSPARDTMEARIFDNAVEYGIPMVGICRGAQFLNVCSGGRMYQDVSRHTASHELIDHETGEHVYVSSTHHQMMKPSENGIIIATSTGVDSYREWFDGHVPRSDVTSDGIEVVWYPKTKALCFQPHPEFSVFEEDYEPMANYFKRLLERFVVPVAMSV